MNACPDRASSTSLLPRGVRRALDAMRANAGHDWSVNELADAAGLSSRTLQRQFREFLGKSPRAALCDIRFENARRELLQGVPDAKVMDVAQRCGFPHCGRFSVEYRRRFGETPSQTVRRQAVFADALSSMPSFTIPSRDRPTIVLAPIHASPEHRDIAHGIADELAYRADPGRRRRRPATGRGALPSDRHHQRIGPAGAPDVPVDRCRNWPLPDGASLRWRARP